MANRISEFRKKSNLSQAKLAEKMGTTRQSISMYEIGKRDPDSLMWQKLANYFDVSVGYLMGVSDDHFSDSSFLNIFNQKYETNWNTDFSNEEKITYVQLTDFFSKILSFAFNSEKDMKKLVEKGVTPEEFERLVIEQKKYTRNIYFLLRKILNLWLQYDPSDSDEEQAKAHEQEWEKNPVKTDLESLKKINKFLEQISND